MENCLIFCRCYDQDPSTIGIQVFMLAPLLYVVSVTDVTIVILNCLLVPLLFLNNDTNVTIDPPSLNQCYNRCSRF